LTEFQIRLGKDLVGGYGDGQKDMTKKVTIAIGKSLTMLKEGTKAYNFFRDKQALLVDESHTFAAEQLNDVCHGVLADVPYRMFVSATQTRNDGTEKLLASIIGENVLTMELKEAIDKGYLCPLKFTVISVKSASNRVIRDPMECKRTHFLRNPKIAEMAAKIANASWELKKQSTLILVEEMEQIEMLQALLRVPFAYVHSGDKKKAKEFNLEKVDLQESVDKFNRGDVKVLIGTKAIATGTNLFPTHNVINWMGGGSEIVTKQGSMGRSTRKLEISKFRDLHTPKPYAMIFDFMVIGEQLLDKQLIKRIEFYKESGGEIKYF
jgi:superfamily II DNA or RNA helicase